MTSQMSHYVVCKLILMFFQLETRCNFSNLGVVLLSVQSEPEMALDAEFLDVYKNCNGVIMMFDITKQW